MRIMRFCLHPLYSLIGKKDVTGRMQQRDCEAKKGCRQGTHADSGTETTRRHLSSHSLREELQKPFWHFIARDAAHQRRCPHPITVELPTSITARSEPHHGFEEE